MNLLQRRFLSLSVVPSILLWGYGPTALANDFPTSARVLFVEDCIRASPGPYFEMVDKCSCAADAVAAQVSYDEFTQMQTISEGIGMGGERGGVFRDTPSLAPQLRKYRDLLAEAKSRCLIKGAT